MNSAPLVGQEQRDSSAKGVEQILSTSPAQERVQFRGSWLTVGFFFLGGEEPFFSSHSAVVDIGYNYQVNASLFSLRFVQTGNLCWTCDMSESWEISILYGRSTISDDFHASVAGGLGLARVDKNKGSPDREGNVVTAVSGAIQAQIFLQVSRSMGVGLNGFANINFQESFYGVTLNLHLGKLR